MSGDGAFVTLSVNTATSSDQLVISVDGEIDAATVGALQAALAAVHPSDCTSVVVDLAGVSFMDCRGLNALLTGRRELARRRIELHVRNAQPQARRLFEAAHDASASNYYQTSSVA